MLCKGTGCENCFKRTTPNYVFCYTTYARQRKEGRKDEGKKKERRKEIWMINWQPIAISFPWLTTPPIPFPKACSLKQCHEKWARIGSMHSWSRHYDVRGQLHTLYTLPSSRQVRYRVEQKHNMHLDLPDIIIRTGVLRLQARLTIQVWLTKTQTYSLAYLRVLLYSTTTIKNPTNYIVFRKKPLTVYNFNLLRFSLYWPLSVSCITGKQGQNM